MTRKMAAELLGTVLLVYFGVGVATVTFGFGVGGDYAAGVVATALVFGLVLLALAYVLGPISGGHVNPAVTMGIWLSGRIPLAEAARYWAAQFAGGIVGRCCCGAPSARRPSTAGRQRAWAPTAGAPTATCTSTWAAPSWPRSS